MTLRFSKRAEALDTAASLISGERDSVYGDPWTNHKRIADLWSVVLGVPITPAQASLCMALVKVSRLVQTPDHADSWIDAAAYMAIGYELAERDQERTITP